MLSCLTNFFLMFLLCRLLVLLYYRQALTESSNVWELFSPSTILEDPLISLKQVSEPRVFVQNKILYVVGKSKKLMWNTVLKGFIRLHTVASCTSFLSVVSYL